MKGILERLTQRQALYYDSREAPPLVILKELEGNWCPKKRPQSHRASYCLADVAFQIARAGQQIMANSPDIFSTQLCT